MGTVNGLSLINPIDPAQLQKDTQRIYEVCDGCRRCFNLCPSFNTLLDGIDRYEGDVAKLTPTDHNRVVDECYYCKLCYNHCPYTPPHQYALDFPRLMIAWKKHLAATRGVGWRDWLLIKTDVIAMAPLQHSLSLAKISELHHKVVSVVEDITTEIHKKRKALQWRKLSLLPIWGFIMVMVVALWIKYRRLQSQGYQKTIEKDERL